MLTSTAVPAGTGTGSSGTNTFPSQCAFSVVVMRSKDTGPRCSVQCLVTESFVMNNSSSTFGWRSWLRFETLLAFVLIIECVAFARIGTNFATRGNVFEIIKFSVEIGLLALVMTPVILTGGIDLSVGSLLGLCAICFGKLWRDAGLAWPVASCVTLAIGAAAGSVNALLITRLRLPPLIVTLG